MAPPSVFVLWGILLGIQDGGTQSGPALCPAGLPNQRLELPPQLPVCVQSTVSGVSSTGKEKIGMNQGEIGTFIAQCRKEKGLTQARLAEQLGITDRAVSKWETGKSMPDASIMLALCGILGITVNELLSGERISPEGFEKKADENLVAMKRKDENNMTKNVIISMLFSATLVIGMMVCLICDLAIWGHATWSPIPVSSIVLAWLILFPSVMLGRRGIMVSLLSASIFIVPYLFLLSRLIGVKEVFSVGAAAAVPTVIYLWIAAGVFHRMGRRRRLTASGIVCLSAIPLTLLINIVVSRLTEEPVLDVWDMVTVLVLLLLAFVFFLVDYGKKKGLIP